MDTDKDMRNWHGPNLCTYMPIYMSVSIFMSVSTDADTDMDPGTDTDMDIDNLNGIILQYNKINNKSISRLVYPLNKIPFFLLPSFKIMNLIYNLVLRHENLCLCMHSSAQFTVRST